MCALTTGGRVHPIIVAGRCAMGSVAIWKRVGGWVSRGFLALLILFEIEYWLDILVFDVKEYERLIGPNRPAAWRVLTAPGPISSCTTRLLSPLRLPRSWHWLANPAAPRTRTRGARHRDLHLSHWTGQQDRVGCDM